MTGSPDCQMPLPQTRFQHELALRVVGTEHNGRILRIQSPKCTIGSAAGCTLRLRAPGVQDVHCLVLRGPGGLAVRSWSADTRLNGQAFLDSPLTPGDRLVVGPVELEVLDASALALPATRNDQALPSFDIARFEQTQKEAQAAIAARDALAHRIAEREDHVARLSTQLSEAERLVEQLKREVSVAPAAADPSGPKVAELEQQIRDLKEAIATAQTARAVDQALFAEERAALQQSLAQALEQFEKHKIQAAHDHARLAADLEKATLAGITSVEQQREYREREVALTHWRERADEQKLRIAELERELAELSSQPTPTSQDHGPLRAELEAAARELDAETERLLQREQALEAKLQGWEAEKLQAAAEIAAQRAQFEQQAAEQDELQARQIAADAAAADALAEEREALTQLSLELEQQRTTLAQQAEELLLARQALATQQEAVATQQNALTEKLNTLTQQQEALTAQLEALAAQQADLAAEQDALTAERDELARFRAAAAQASAAPAADDKTDAHPAPTEQDETPYQPQSASDIIAKLSASGLWKDDVPEDQEPAAAKTPEPAWKSLVPEQETKAPATVAATDEEDSIEAYMQRLLQRVSGDDSSSRRPMANHAAPVAAPAPTERTAAPPAPAKADAAEEPFDFNSYVPRTAPELTANLAAMRELANTSARTAIDSSSKRKQAKHATSKIVLSLGAIGTAIALGWLSLRTHSLLSYYAALSAGAASLLWGLHAGYLWIKARRHKSSAGGDAANTEATG